MSQQYVGMTHEAAEPGYVLHCVDTLSIITMITALIGKKQRVLRVR